MHSRSFSNDRAIAMSLEARRHRRNISRQQDWTPTEVMQPMVEAEAEAEAEADVDVDTESRPGASRSDYSVKSHGPAPARGPVTWMSLPRKDQLLVLFVGRLVDFLQVASLQAYVFYQLRAMDGSLSDARISQQAGILQGCFTGAQVCTAILWGKAADASWCGRKWVLVVGLGGTAVSCLGYGFATTFFWAALWRIFGGAINGTVGIM